MSRFGHALPFGADLLDGGRVRFRLWAPSARRVELVRDGRSEAMTAGEGGWYETITPAAAGSRYRYRIDGDVCVPDPASRAQADDVHGDSLVVDPFEHRWQCTDWRGRPWREIVIQELHVGCCGGFDGVAARLPRLAELGITAVELMPVAAFSGRRNWGYDGVLPFAPASAYGSPAQLKALVDRAHALGLCVYLDVVYNHFGPDGNYLHVYAEEFFDAGRQSPWGAAIDFRRPQVREFFIENALYWLHEYRFDGLRLDAVHAIGDPGFVDEIGARVRASVEPGRHVHLMLENEHNRASHLRGDFDAQWNDDFHNALHALLTGEHEGYYANYHPQPLAHLLRVLGEGFAFQGQTPPTSAHPRGEPSGDLPPTRFIGFLQNHDQIGNRACGERLLSLLDADSVAAAVVLQLLSPHVPLLFMGEEHGETRPFLFFTDFHAELGDAVREGRRREFAAFSSFQHEASRAQIPDPNAESTFTASIPDFDDSSAGAERWRRFYGDLLRARRRHLQPWLDACRCAGAQALGERGLIARWRLGADGLLVLAANFDDVPLHLPVPDGDILGESRDGAGESVRSGVLPARAAVAFLRAPGAALSDDAAVPARAAAAPAPPSPFAARKPPP